MIKYPALMALFFGAVACCEDPVMDVVKEEPSCDEVECAIQDEFYGVGLLNGECWYAERGWIDSSNPYVLSIYLAANTTNEIIDELSFIVNDETALSDTIWLGWAYSNIPIPNVASTRYAYIEDHSNVGSFSFERDSPLTYQDYLLIDYFNADTTIVEGHFQVKLPHRSVNSFVTHAPDSMNIRCGRFRANAN
ncbi:hypothetical protein [Lewinella sp. LCG006]|uniref:hypothetical protein n=1 Tax=Lewinella sp. LCG006 TaxID=3231911 RepID=UPI0034617392